MQDIPADTEKRGPSSRVLQEVIRQARQWSVQKLSCADCVAASSTCHQTLIAHFAMAFSGVKAERDWLGVELVDIYSGLAQKLAEFLHSLSYLRGPSCSVGDSATLVRDGRRSRLWHQEPHDRGGKQAYRRHTQKCCRPIKIRGHQPKECSAERSTKS